MPNRTVVAVLAFALPPAALAQSIVPATTHWIRNTGGQVGYGGIPANVTLVRHSANFVYPSSSGSPATARSSSRRRRSGRSAC